MKVKPVLLIVAGIFLLIATVGCEDISEFWESRSGIESIAEATCDELAGKKALHDQLHELYNKIDEDFEVWRPVDDWPKVVRIEVIAEVSHTDKELICGGHVKFDNGKKEQIRFRINQDDDGDVFIAFQTDW